MSWTSTIMEKIAYHILGIGKHQISMHSVSTLNRLWEKAPWHERFFSF